MSDIPQQPDIDRSTHHLDYELEPTVVADTPAQLKALADPVRAMILDLVLDRAATTAELAEALGKPNGTVDHHLKVLQRAGLLRVVRTRKVRAMTESFWGRTARTIMFHGSLAPPSTGEAADRGHGSYFVAEALREWRAMPPQPADTPQFSTLRRARIAPERIGEFIDRLNALAVEFSETRRGGDTAFAMLLAVYPTALPTLKDPS